MPSSRFWILPVGLPQLIEFTVGLSAFIARQFAKTVMVLGPSHSAMSSSLPAILRFVIFTLTTNALSLLVRSSSPYATFEIHNGRIEAFVFDRARFAKFGNSPLTFSVILFGGFQ